MPTRPIWCCSWAGCILLSDGFVATFPELINLHPAFLPLDPQRDDVVFPDGARTAAFRGAYAVRDALAGIGAVGRRDGASRYQLDRPRSGARAQAAARRVVRKKKRR